jgi:26S proteasome regulatory subunit T6
MSLQRGINLRALAEKMGQCSGAEVRGICTEAGSLLPCEMLIIRLFYLRGRFIRPIGMYALRERRHHVTQEDFEFAVAKVRMASAGVQCADPLTCTGTEEEPGRKHVC